MNRRNWAGNQVWSPARTVAARDAGEVVDAVAAAARDGLHVRAIGSGHSFTGAAVTDGVQLIVPSAELKIEDGLATVAAGMPLRTLNALLWDRGRALPNLGDIDAQTVAGAISTGTHGTGATYQGIASQVRALDLVLADGTPLHCSPAANPDVFAAARVGLGALGILVSVTLQTVPAFRLHAVEEARPLTEVLEGFEELATAHDHVEFYWFPHTDVAALKRNDRTDDDGPRRGRVASFLGDDVLGNGAFALACRLGEVVPRLVPGINRLAAGQFAAAEYVDRSYRVFCSPRRVRFLEMEYAVPADALGEAFAGLRAAVERHGRDVTFPVEVRVAAADDVPLSTASGRDSAYLAVHVHRGRPHEAYFEAVEQVMVGIGGRPHWGKLHTRTAAQLAGSYPDFAAFVALRDRLDPERRFGNAYLGRVLG